MNKRLHGVASELTESDAHRSAGPSLTFAFGHAPHFDRPAFTAGRQVGILCAETYTSGRLFEVSEALQFAISCHRRWGKQECVHCLLRTAITWGLPNLQTFTEQSSPPVARTRPEVGPIAAHSAFPSCATASLYRNADRLCISTCL